MLHSSYKNVTFWLRLQSHAFLNHLHRKNLGDLQMMYAFITKGIKTCSRWFSFFVSQKQLNNCRKKANFAGEK